MPTNERSISVMTHGRYVTELNSVTQARMLIVGFHGYSENADIHLQRLKDIAIQDAHYCSIQGLHLFYRQKQIAASWMCSQNRDAHIVNNINYINAVLDQLATELHWQYLIFAGFSQGAAMAYRSAALGTHPCDALIINGGDVPPDLTATQLGTLPPTYIIRGDSDNIYSAEQLQHDLTRLQSVQTQSGTFAGPHSWPSAASALCRNFLNQQCTR